MRQIDKVRQHLEAGKHITPMIAMTVYGISRLSSCIEDLRAAGMEIDMALRFDEAGKQYGEYRKRRPITAGVPVQVRAGHGVGLPRWVRKLTGATVAAVREDAALVTFRRGQNEARHWLNQKELVTL